MLNPSLGLHGPLLLTLLSLLVTLNVGFSTVSMFIFMYTVES